MLSKKDVIERSYLGATYKKENYYSKYIPRSCLGYTSTDFLKNSATNSQTSSFLDGNSVVTTVLVSA